MTDLEDDSNLTPDGYEVNRQELAQALSRRIQSANAAKEDLKSQVTEQFRFYQIPESERVFIETLALLPNYSQYAWVSNRVGFQDHLESLVIGVRHRPGTPPPIGLFLHTNPIKRSVSLKLKGNTWHPQPKKSEDSGTVGNTDVETLRVLAIDVDIDRPSGSSGTKGECALALRVAGQIHVDLTELLGTDEHLGFLFSGNGVQLHLLLDSWENCKSNVERNDRFLRVLDLLYGKKGSHKVDPALSDPRRILPLAGTMKCKGGNDVEEGRLHRLTWFSAPKTSTPLSLDAFTKLLSTLESKLNDEQKLALDPQKEEMSPVTKPKAPSTANLKEFFEVANRIPIRDVITTLGRSLDPLACPSCGKEGTGNVTIPPNPDGGVEFLKCWNANTCKTAKGWVGPGTQLVSEVLRNVKSPRGDDARFVINWYREHFPNQVPMEKSKAELAAERAAAKAATAKAEAKRQLGISDPVPEPQGNNEPEKLSEPRKTDVTFAKQDIGNAKRFIVQHGLNVKYCTKFRCWLAWDGKVWVEDDKENRIIKQLAHKTVESLQEEVLAATTPEEVLEATQFAKTSGSTARIRGMLEQAEGLPGVNVDPVALDADPWLLNTQNGIVDLQTGELGPHRREALCTKITSVEYPTTDVETPNFDAFMAQVLPDAGTREYLMKYDGYSLTGIIHESLFVINVGEGRNGKGTHQRICLCLLGGYAGIMNPALFIQGKPGQAQQNDRYRAKLFGKRMVFSSETEANVHLNTTEINSITGDDMLSAKKLYKDDIDFLPTHKLQLATNHNPIVTDTTEATWRRLVLIQWTYTVPAGKETGGLSNRIIREEGAGILRRLVLACLRWQREGLTLPKAILESTETYRMEEDRLGRFTAACLTVGVDKEIGADELYTAYAMWAEGSGMKPTSDQKFWKLYRKRPGITKGQNANGQMVYKGVSKKVVANDSSCGQEKLLRGRDTDLTSDEIDRLLHETKANPQLQSHSTEASEATGKVLKGVMKNDDRRSGRTLKENLPTPSVASGDSKESQDSNTVTIGASPLMTLVTATGQAFEVCNRAGWLFVRLELDDGSEAVDARNLQSPNLNAVCELYGVTLPEPSDEYHPVTGTRRVLVEARPDETFGVRVVSVARLAA